MNNVSQSEIKRMCDTDKNTQEQSQDSDALNKSEDGYEIRIGRVAGIGKGTVFVDDKTYADNLETKTNGIQLQVGILKKDTYIYTGFQATEDVEGKGDGEGDVRVLLLGIESLSRSKFSYVYGGEIGFGTQSYANGDGYGVFAVEPYVGVRYNITNHVNLNAKLGYRVKMMSAEAETSYGTSTVEIYDMGVASAFSIGYLFN
jgi:hypothetical protein